MEQPTTIRLDAKTKKLLDEYCSDNGIKMSNAIRDIVSTFLENYKRRGELGFVDSVGPEGLMVNEKRAIRASIESTLILRKVAKSLLKNSGELVEIDEDVKKIMKDGWEYDNGI